MALVFYNGSFTYYDRIGDGPPVLLIPGNTASSRIFIPLVWLLKKKYSLIVTDLPGHGKSKRIDTWPQDYWFESAKVIEDNLLDLINGQVHVIGIGGGALVALNLAIKKPELVKSIVADSIEGVFPHPGVLKFVRDKRNALKWSARGFFFWYACHGRGWTKILEQDREMYLKFAEKEQSFIQGDLAEIQCPVLFTGSREDKLITGIEDIIKTLCACIPNSRSHVFEKGSHPSFLSNSGEFAELAMRFFEENDGKIE